MRSLLNVYTCSSLNQLLYSHMQRYCIKSSTHFQQPDIIQSSKHHHPDIHDTRVEQRLACKVT